MQLVWAKSTNSPTRKSNEVLVAEFAKIRIFGYIRAAPKFCNFGYGNSLMGNLWAKSRLKLNPRPSRGKSASRMDW